jgi:hypothetical protein
MAGGAVNMRIDAGRATSLADNTIGGMCHASREPACATRGERTSGTKPTTVERTVV